MPRPRHRFALHGRIVGNGYRTMRAFAAKTGIHYSILSEIITGKKYPGKVHVRAISQGLHITLAELESLLDA